MNPENLYNNTEKKETHSAIKLSDPERKQIRNITLGIEEIDDNILEMAVDDVSATLENGHPLNRLIINQAQELSGYIACEDFIPNEAYIKYLGTNTSSGRNLLKEIPAFLQYAEEQGYTKLSFHGWNDRLNNIMKKYGFEKIKTDTMGHINVDFFEKDLTSTATNEEIEAKRQKAFAEKYLTKVNTLYKKHVLALRKVTQKS